MGVNGGDKPTAATDATFLQLVAMFQMAALQQMGKLVNPLTNEVDRDLSHARSSIDVLESIRRKTAGNLSGEESTFLDKVIFELQMNFVEESKKSDETTEDAGKASDGGVAGGDKGPDEGQAPVGDDSNDGTATAGDAASESP